MREAAPLYARLQARAREIARGMPPPAFYRDKAEAVGRSHAVFESAPLVRSVRQELGEILDEGYGHGMRHASQVALDAGALVWVEGSKAGIEEAALLRRVEIAHLAGLLHDILRREDRHAERGADLAAGLLSGRSLQVEEIEDIRLAIRNHEAFRPVVAVDTQEGALLSDCLYDADKFRWGPDNFTDTLWEMVAAAGLTPEALLARWPLGIDSLARIRDTFRTPTGRRYGPQFIDHGIAIGNTLFRLLAKEVRRCRGGSPAKR